MIFAYANGERSMKINKSAARAMDILNLFAEQKDDLTMAEVSKMLDMPKSSAFELLYTLVDREYLEIADKKLKSFKLGIKAFHTGIAYLEKTDLRKEAHPLLEAMMEKIQETVFLVTESKGKVVYIDKVESPKSVKTFSNLGTTNPMHCTGVGKALLAAYSNDKVKEITDLQGLRPKTKYSISDYNQLIADLDQARKRGYVIDNRESEEEVFCVAAPLYDMSGKPAASISVACLASRMVNHPERVEQIGCQVNETALAISRRLGFRGKKLFPEFC